MCELDKLILTVIFGYIKNNLENSKDIDEAIRKSKENGGKKVTKDKWINIRCTEQERQEITEQAKKNNMSVAQFIRYLVAKERKEREK